MNDAIRMQISAFVDGELPENEAEMLLRRMSQDSELRREVAEYLAIGRLMRREPGLAGADRLHERITAEIDHRPVDVDAEHSDAIVSRAVRPLAGIAIAATVALVAIFALQQNTAIDEQSEERPLVAGPQPTVPVIDAQQERQRQYFINHAETSSQLGANGMNSRVVTLRFSEELPEQPVADDNDAADETEIETEETTQQP